MEKQETKVDVSVENRGIFAVASDNAAVEMSQYNNCITIRMGEQNQISSGEQGMDDTDYVNCKAEKVQESFVKTSPFMEALDKFSKNNVILLIGNSGSGKTNNSIMLAAGYSKDYTLIWAEGHDSEKVELEKLLKEIKSKNNYRKKEIIIFDDFLGKTCLNIDNQYPDRIYELIKSVRSNPNKRLILNSRKTILEDAKTKSVVFSKCIENGDCELVDVSHLESLNEKCQIIVHYACECKMQAKAESLVSDEKLLFRILKHENFSPLIVKNVFTLCSQKADSDLGKVFTDALDNPDYVWDLEIKALNDYSKKYLYLLYSLSDTWIEEKYIDECFDACIDSHEYTENIEKTRQRLRNLVKSDDRNRIAFMHPSIIDYIKKEISGREVEEILDHAVYIEQIERLDKGQKRLRLLANDIDQFFRLKVMPYKFLGEILGLPNYIGIKYLDYIIKFEVVVDEEILVLILEEIFKGGHLLVMHSAEIILQVLKRANDCSEVLNNEAYMKELLSCLDYENMWDLISILNAGGTDGLDFKQLKPFIQYELKDKLNCAVSDAIIDYIQERIEDYAEEYFSELEDDVEFFMDDVANELVEGILSELNLTSLAAEVRVNLCEKHKLHHYEDAIQEYKIEYDDYLDLGFVTSYLEDYWEENYCNFCSNTEEDIMNIGTNNDGSGMVKFADGHSVLTAEQNNNRMAWQNDADKSMCTKNKKDVFLSYCWSDDSIADEIFNYLDGNQNINLHRDKIDIGSWRSIKEYMQSIPRMDYMILLISDEYLRSVNCMYEVLEVMRDRNYKDKIFPAVITKTIYNPINRIDYVKYWEQQYKEMKKELQGIGLQNVGKLVEDLKRMQSIAGNMADFLDAIADMNNPKIEDVKLVIENKLNDIVL